MVHKGICQLDHRAWAWPDSAAGLFRTNRRLPPSLSRIEITFEKYRSRRFLSDFVPLIRRFFDVNRCRRRRRRCHRRRRRLCRHLSSFAILTNRLSNLLCITI